MRIVLVALLSSSATLACVDDSGPTPRGHGHGSSVYLSSIVWDEAWHTKQTELAFDGDDLDLTSCTSTSIVTPDDDCTPP